LRVARIVNDGAGVRTALARFLGLAALWMVLIRSLQPSDLAVGALAAAAATWVSLRLLPPDAGRVKFAALLARSPRFLWLSVLAGIDVARRALSPSLPLRTGFVSYRTSLPRGQARNSFATITSLFSKFIRDI
jgi:multicomponent Na+:H+ antiporter subunit E